MGPSTRSSDISSARRRPLRSRAVCPAAVPAEQPAERRTGQIGDDLAERGLFASVVVAGMTNFSRISTLPAWPEKRGTGQLLGLIDIRLRLPCQQAQSGMLMVSLHDST